MPEDRADVAVVGGGIIGCACAHELSRRGARVTLVERSELAAEASGRNHGLLLTPLDPALLPMARASTAAYEEAVPRAPLAVHLDPRPVGLLVVAMAEEERPAARAEAAAAEAVGVKAERLDRGELREAEPALAPDAVEGWLVEDGRRTDPAALTVALGLMAAEHGARIRPGLTARSLVVRGEAVRGVVTDRGTVESDWVVLAAGPWSAPLLAPLGVRLPVAGARGWLVHLGSPEPVVRTVVAGAGWHVLPDREPFLPPTARDLAAGGPRPEVGTLVQPNPDGTTLVGGSRQPAVAAEPEDPAVPREILRLAVRVVPALDRAAVLSARWGIRPMTPDGRPIVDRVGEGLIVATGHGSQGLILGGGTAALVASTVAGEPPPFDPGPFRLERFGTAGPPVSP